MEKLAHHVTLEAFVKYGDSLSVTERAFDRLVPVPLAELHTVQWRWHPDRERTKVYALPKRGVTLFEAETEGEDGKIVVLQYRFTKQRDTAAFLERVRTELGEEERRELLNHLQEYVEGGTLSFRLNRKALELGLLKLAERGDCVFVRITLAAFPKKEETCAAVARRALGGNEE